ncbi:MAG: type II toxin-antitoxin system prevent-host-death family antitoxin [Deltaproteobacteria bacterium]|nr:type II toxin-antitoxin system prevent-host-death family antitoxin [Deltaproteobacteria bacterium]
MITTAKKLRFNVREILETTRRGEDVIVTYRGKPTAVIISIAKNSKRTKKQTFNKLFGIWKNIDAAQNVNDYVNNLRKGRTF